MNLEKMFYESKPYLYGAFGVYAMMTFTKSQVIFFLSCILLYLAYAVIRRRIETRKFNSSDS